jgi:hypothetical protein
MHFCLGNHFACSLRVISAQMGISSPFFSQLQAWSDQVLADAQLDPKMSQLNQINVS